MRKSMKIFAVTFALAAGLAAAPALYAHDSERSDGSMGPGMMGQGGMMGMMGQMSGTMEGCSEMMRSKNNGGSGKPNEQWRKNAPEGQKKPEKDG